MASFGILVAWHFAKVDCILQYEIAEKSRPQTMVPKTPTA